ncbi:plasma membrane calcium-transporting ATPase 3 [Rhizodiscina lignyota]|uniref:Calcium-transporting ATPase n=1 Tax=Rhizodiscina lignyota TaxID=1504668 RepID=A0A9P4IKA1_9PEZI|nr:plasma membrane calcium-transporting ATPase 3 [Rhizodiscina lignyota]
MMSLETNKGPPGGEGRNTPSPGPGRRPRAPTITIDTSAVNQQTDMGQSENIPHVQYDDRDDESSTAAPSLPPSQPPSQASPVELRNAPSFESYRPQSPHNVSSPTSRGTHHFLEVPGTRSRNNSFDTDGGQSSASGVSSFADSTTIAMTPSPGSEHQKGAGVKAQEIIGDDEALKPDPGTEADFEVENNKFAYSPGQLGKMLNPKSLAAFHASAGLSMDEEELDGGVSFDDAIGAAHNPSRTQTLKRSETSGTRGSRRQKDAAYADRKRVFSDNRLPERKAKSIFKLAWMAYNDKVLILLTIAAVISLALGLYETFGQTHEDGEAPVEWVEGVAIMVAILIVVVVGALNDWQKERQFVKLNKKKDDRLIKVIRSGKTREINVHDIFVGDVVLLEPGDMVPVDGVFIEGHGVKCDESSATGESDLLRKTPADEVYDAIDKHMDLKKMDPFILSGAKVSEGVGSFLVTSTGIHSSYGKTMMSLREENEVTPLQSKLNTLAEYIAKLGGAAALLLFIVLLIEFLVNLKGSTDSPAQKGQHFLNILIQAITVVVVAVPEGLPLAVTLALAFATTRMLKDNNLVRLLRSCETMGNATTICSDKTGTLTQNKMTVVAGVLGTSAKFGNKGKPTNQPNGNIHSRGATDGAEDDVVDTDETASGFAESLGKEVRELFEQEIVVNSTAFEGEEDGKPAFIGSKTETALLNFAREYLGMGDVNVERSNANIPQFVPFDSGRKCMAAVVKLNDGRHRMYVKGASEILLAHAAKIIVDPTRDLNAVEMSNEQRELLGHVISSYASRSLRTIAFLYRDFDQQWPPQGFKTWQDDPTQADFDSIFRDMTFLGVVGIQDPLRPGVREAVEDCQHAGVFVRMVTGDNVETARAIAQDCGILVPGGMVMEGPKFRKLSKREMNQAIPKLCVLARSSPEDKRVLVKRLKELGETVAVTGDGTNDAPALKTADVGFSMGIAGTEVAKEASAIILMDDNFSSIVKALLWGRAVNDAVKKFLQFQITVNITAVALTFVSAVASSDQSSVLTAVQLLWVNLIMDTFAALALATDPPTRSMLDRKPDPKSAPLITLTMWKMIIGQAIYQLVVTFVLHFAGASILGYNAPPDGVTKTMIRHDPQYAAFKNWLNLDTLVFNTFVWMQIFNQLNNRRLDNRFNIFEGIQRNYFFIAINLIMVGGQVMIIYIGGAALTVDRLNGAQWGISLILGALSIPIGVIIRLVPDDFVLRLIPRAFKRKAAPSLLLEDENEQFQWNPGMLEIRDELTFIRRMRGGRITHLKWKMTHPRELLRSRSGSRLSSSHDLPQTPTEEDRQEHGGTPSAPTPESRSRKRGRSRSNSAFGAATAMAGIVAGSIAGWSPIERGHDDSDSMKFARTNNRADLESQAGIEVHPDTRHEDPVLVADPLQDPLHLGVGIPPSQTVEMTPNFILVPPALECL